MALAFLAITLVGPAASAEAQSRQTPEPTTTSRTEVVSSRSEFSKVYRESDGTLTAEIHTRPVHYERADGTWASVDPTLRMTSAKGFAWQNVGGPLELSFAQIATSETIARVETDAGSIAFGVNDTFPSLGVVVEDRVTYTNALPDADLVYESKEAALKELIVLRQPPGHAVSFRFSVALDGLTPRIEEDGSISLLDAGGRIELVMPAASMTDASMDPTSAEGAFSDDVELELSQQDGEYVLTVTPDLTWLQDPTRVYPVSIDPTVTKYATLDTFVQTGISSGQSGSDELKAGTFDSGATKARSLVKFDMSSLSGKEIIDATFSLWEFHSWSCTASQVQARRILDSWGSGVNWANQPAYNGSSFDTLNVAKGFSGSCPDGRINFDALGPVEAWASGSHPNHGIVIRAADETANNGWKKFRSEDYGGSSTDPRLEVTYNSYPTAVTTRLPANGTVSADTTPTFSAKYNDPDSGDVGHVDYQVCSNSGCSSVVVSGSGTLGVNPGQASPWTMPSASALTTGQTYWWRARSDDGRVQSAWSSTWTYIPNASPPATPTDLVPNTGIVTTLTPSFSATYDDVDPTDLGYVRFEVYNAATNLLVAAGNGTTVAPGETSKWTLPSALTDGTSFYWRSWSNDGSLTSASTPDRDILVAVGGDVYQASLYTDDPANGGELIAQESARINTRTARYEDDEQTQTRSPTSCPATYPAGQECEDVRSITVNSPGGNEFYSSYLAPVGSPNLEMIVSILAPANEELPVLVATGPLSDILTQWQTPPPLAGQDYELYEEADPDSGNTSSLWIDSRTRLPLKHTMRAPGGELLGTLYWTYDATRTAISSLPSDFFTLTAPAQPAVEELVEFHGIEDIGPITDIETGTSFRPFYLGPITSIASTTGGEITLCLSRVATVRSIVDPDQVEIVEGGELEEDLVPDPSGPETAVVADYVEVPSASECDPGREGDEADLTLISEASASSTAEASRNAYIDPATTIENDPLDPDHQRAGLQTVAVLGYSRTSYVVPVNEDDTSAVITPSSENTTIMITGDFDKTTVDDIASELELR